jgi:hypothetical protein
MAYNEKLKAITIYSSSEMWSNDLLISSYFRLIQSDRLSYRSALSTMQPLS